MNARLEEPDARRLAGMFRERFGWEFGPEARVVFESRLGRRRRELSIGWPEYVERIVHAGEGGPGELEQIADLLTTRETYFFREGYQLRTLTAEILPRLLRDRPIRIWSAGCSSGEEAYTVAMLALETLGGRPFEVIGTDVAPAALAAAQRGVYDAHALRETPAAARDRWFVAERGAGTGPAGEDLPDRWRVADEVRRWVSFSHRNLATDAPPPGPFDVILCRNVIIYFALEAKKRLARTFFESLAPGGWLLLGHAESLVAVTRDFDLVTLSNDVVYRRPAEERRLKVLLADDSAFARRTLSRIVQSLEGAELVGAAPDGMVALKEIRSKAPDVILLDLEMPVLDGFAVLRAVREMPEPPQVIVISAMSQAANVVRALELGAFDFLAKPGHEATPELEGIARELGPRLAALRDGARARPITSAVLAGTPARPVPAVRTSSGANASRVVVIGASTGGPGALLDILGALPGDLPAAVVIALHMPSGFTHAFAERLARRGPLPAAEATHGATLREGHVYVCPGGQHVALAPGAGGIVVMLEPAKNDPVVPSVDRLFTSAAALGPAALGVVLTGMGRDGAEGAPRLRATGGRILVESAETAIVNGMPAAVIDAGAADAIHRRDELAKAIRRWTVH